MSATEKAVTTLTPSSQASALTGKAFIVHDPSTGDASAVETSVITGLIGDKYTKPSGGIPASDLAGDIPKTKLDSSVQTSLGKADTAVQDVSGKADKPTSAVDGNLAKFNGSKNPVDSGIPADNVTGLDERMYGAEFALSQPANVADFDELPLLCGQPMKLFGNGAPSASTVPDNWKQFLDGGYNWDGTPSALGQEYINYAVTSGGHYTAIRDGNMGLKWYLD